MTDKLKQTVETALEVLTKVKYGLERNRVWGGMGWSYVPIHPTQYLPLVDDLEKQMSALRQALAEPDTGKDEETTRDEYTKAIEDALNYGQGFVKVQHVEPSNTEVEYWRKKAEHLEQENFAWRTKLAVRGYEIEIESLRQELAELRNSTTDVVEPIGEIVAIGALDAVKIPEMPPVGTKLYAAPPKTNTEPFAWVGEDESGYQEIDWDKDDLRDFPFLIPLYKAPPKPQWKGLTYEEVEKLCMEFVGQFQKASFARAIEAKLKEKNT